MATLTQAKNNYSLKLNLDKLKSTSNDIDSDTDSDDDQIDNVSFVEWTNRCENLLYFFASHKAAGTLRDNKFLLKSFNFCAQLFQLDDDIIIIDNYGKQELCDSYPLKLILSSSFINHINSNNNNDLLRIFERARYARVHRRFVIPVIFLPNNSCIARSSTLSTTGELLLNKASTVVSGALNYSINHTESPMGHDLNALRVADIKLLNYFNIKFICDLMVEDKKKVGWGRYGSITVTSSEKVDREQRYKSFYLNSIPYPGCEFFKYFTFNNYNANNLIFKWDQQIHDAELNLHWIGNNGDINWNSYKKWDIIKLTQNYLRLMTDYIKSSLSNSDNDNIGLLIHCISGWDRTPLFISLIRLSLWADGIIHSELDSSQILYLTLSYDWLLFTHQLGQRLIKHEHIFKFTFYMLQYIYNEKYSIWFNNNKDIDYLKKKKKNKNNKINKKNKIKNGKKHIKNKIKKLTKITKKSKQKINKITKITKNGSNKLISKFSLKSKKNNQDYNQDNNEDSSSSLDVDTIISSFADDLQSNNKQYFQPFSPPVNVIKPIKPIKSSKSVNILPSAPILSNNLSSKSNKSNKSINSIQFQNNNNSQLLNNQSSLSHSWEKKGCGLLTTNIRHSYIPTMLTPPAPVYNKHNGKQPPQLQLVRTMPITVNTTPKSYQNNNQNNKKNCSWQFVDNNKDSPMFQFISTPKSDPAIHYDHLSSVPPDLMLSQDDMNTSSHSDVHVQHRYSLSAPSSAPSSAIKAYSILHTDLNKLNFKDISINNASPSPEILDHPETNIIDMKDDDNDIQQQTLQNNIVNDIAKELVDNILQSVVNNCIDNDNDNDKATTIASYLGLNDNNAPNLQKVESIELNDNNDIIDNNNKTNNGNLDKCIQNQQNSNNEWSCDKCTYLNKQSSIKCEMCLNDKHKTDNSNSNSNRLTATNRKDKLEQVHILFTKIWKQVMEINDPPIFYKQSSSNNNDNNNNNNNNNDLDDFNTYFTNSSNDGYQNIANYLKSMLPASLIGNGYNNNDEYDDNE